MVTFFIMFLHLWISPKSVWSFKAWNRVQPCDDLLCGGVFVGGLGCTNLSCHKYSLCNSRLGFFYGSAERTIQLFFITYLFFSGCPLVAENLLVGGVIKWAWSSWCFLLKRTSCKLDDVVYGCLFTLGLYTRRNRVVIGCLFPSSSIDYFLFFFCQTVLVVNHAPLYELTISKV